MNAFITPYLVFRFVRLFHEKIVILYGKYVDIRKSKGELKHRYVIKHRHIYIYIYIYIYIMYVYVYTHKYIYIYICIYIIYIYIRI